jgi:hypothetical protein
MRASRSASWKRRCARSPPESPRYSSTRVSRESIETLVDAPAQDVAPVRTKRDRFFTEHGEREPIEPLARQFDAQVRDDAARSAPQRELARQPALHARVRRDHAVRRERMLRRHFLHQFLQRAEQRLQAAGAVDDQPAESACI